MTGFSLSTQPSWRTIYGKTGRPSAGEAAVRPSPSAASTSLLNRTLGVTSHLTRSHSGSSKSLRHDEWPCETWHSRASTTKDALDMWEVWYIPTALNIEEQPRMRTHTWHHLTHAAKSHHFFPFLMLLSPWLSYIFTVRRKHVHISYPKCAVSDTSTWITNDWMTAAVHCGR